MKSTKILKSLGINIDDGINGVFLPGRGNKTNTPGIQHNGKHPNKYFDAVNARIKEANSRGGKSEVIKELGIMRDILLKAPRDAKWKVVMPNPEIH